ncbi:hypothetical protein [Terracidiphilus gabretensis]|uniref:hypothetical protein n=1 Tax=Terracidiphilus gabretensis TaxID=1577687 RepID=UPI0012F8E297|nr:hypothetical protein [Terracidiphilus gabretensis]
MQTSTAFAPSPNPGIQPDSFAAFLARLADLPDWDSDPAVEPSGTYASSEPAEAGEEDLASLSYENALRTPALKANRAGNSQPLKPASKTALAIQPSPKSLEPRAQEFRPLEIIEPRHARTTIRFTAGENKLLRKRAVENNIAVSAYVRSCVLEVESLRAQIRQFQQLMTELRPPQTPRPQMQPLTARAPQPVSTLRLDPRVQAAFDAQKRISMQPSPTLPQKQRPGLFSFLFGNRRSA